MRVRVPAISFAFRKRFGWRTSIGPSAAHKTQAEDTKTANKRTEYPEVDSPCIHILPALKNARPRFGSGAGAGQSHVVGTAPAIATGAVKNRFDSRIDQ